MGLIAQEWPRTVWWIKAVPCGAWSELQRNAVFPWASVPKSGLKPLDESRRYYVVIETCRMRCYLLHNGAKTLLFTAPEPLGAENGYSKRHSMIEIEDAVLCYPIPQQIYKNLYKNV